jgi:hypothetical protein
MKLTKKTLNLLENFASISDSILIQPGNKIKTMSSSKSLLVTAEVEEEFPQELPIYSLTKFLSLVKCVEKPQLTFDENTIFISNDEDTIEFRLSDKTIIQTPPNKSIELPTEDVELEVSTQQFDKCQKVARTMQHKHLAFVGDGENVWLKVLDKNNSGSDTFKTKVGETDKTFTAFVLLDNLKFQTGYYDLVMCKKNIMKLVSHHENVHYFVALEPDSDWSDFSDEEVVVEAVTEEVVERELVAA